MTEELPRKLPSVGCLIVSLLVLVFGGLAAWRDMDNVWVTVIFAGMCGLVFGVYATVKAFDRGSQRRAAKRAARAKEAATNARRRHREWRRVGVVLSAVAAGLACVPFERSVSTLLRAYEAAEVWHDRREIEAIVVGLARYTGFPGLLHASAAVLMTAVTIVLFAGLALLLASDVWLPGKRNDATEAYREPNRPKPTPESGR